MDARGRMGATAASDRFLSFHPSVAGETGPPMYFPINHYRIGWYVHKNRYNPRMSLRG